MSPARSLSIWRLRLQLMWMPSCSTPATPALATKELGGTGRTHDWALSRRIREVIRKPLFLAGGLNPSNVAMAITAVRPFGIDVCRGVRTNDKLDAAKLAAFFDALPK